MSRRRRGLDMRRLEVIGRSRDGGTAGDGGALLVRQHNDLSQYQTRKCVRCGRSTTFVLDDAAGGWYACIECGRYA
jgi:hypothetical protein